MLKRLSNITILVLCGVLAVGIIITRQIDTAIETNLDRRSANEIKQRDFTVDCIGAKSTLISLPTSNWVRLNYTLPSHSSYSMYRVNDSWEIDGTSTNDSATAIYLNKIATAQWSCTVAHNSPDILVVPDYILDIVTSNGDTLSYETFVVDTAYIIRDNNKQLYLGNADSLFWQLYFGKHRFNPDLANH